ncbi:Hypothetical predicted protein, partial [Mytilus galloprovincialis]
MYSTRKKEESLLGRNAKVSRENLRRPSSDTSEFMQYNNDNELHKLRANFTLIQSKVSEGIQKKISMSVRAEWKNNEAHSG